MAIELDKFSDLTQAEVTEQLDEFIQRVQEAHPTLDLKRGVIRDIVGQLNAQTAALLQKSLDRYLSARSLQAIQSDPTLADDDIVDHVLSNFRITRQSASNASGDVVIVVSSSNSVTIPAGAQFQAEGLTFTADSVFTAKSDSGQINSSTDKLMTQLSNGNYAFTITVTADEAGTDGELPKDTALVPLTPPRNFVSATAASDFTGGRDAETNEQLLERLQTGMATSAPSNRVNMRAMLDDISGVSVVRSSIIGYSDVEMLRDQHTIWPGSLGGKSDWYVRTNSNYVAKTITKEATLVEKNDDGSGIWQFSLVKDDVPGFYEVESVQLPDADVLGTFEITSDSRDNDTTDDYVPDILTVSEGAYSRYQTSIIKFKDTDTDHSSLAIGDTADYSVAVRYMPDIGTIQDALNARDKRAYGSDILIKAPVPCFVDVSFKVVKKQTTADPDTAAMAQAIVEEINSTPFIGKLYSSKLYDAAHAFLSNESSITSMDMFGRIRRPDGTLTYLRDSEVLEVPSDADEMVSDKTVQFFAKSDDVSITVVSGLPLT